MASELVEDDASIVLVGSFNPTIFHPSWLAAHQLLTAEQAAAATNVNLVHAQVSQFSAGYLHFEFIPERALVRGQSLYLGYLQDFVLRAFGEVLPHVPIYQVGLNRHFKISFPDDEERSRFGRLIAPPDPWLAWDFDARSDKNAPKGHGGMMRLQMREAPRPDGRAGYTQIDVQPVQDSEKLVSVDINNHFDVGKEEAQGAGKALEVVRECWDSVNDRNDALVKKLRETIDA